MKNDSSLFAFAAQNAREQAASILPRVGVTVRMTALSSNWCLGEIGTVVSHFPQSSDRFGIITPRFMVVFDGRGDDDYVAFPGDCEVVS